MKNKIIILLPLLLIFVATKCFAVRQITFDDSSDLPSSLYKGTIAWSSSAGSELSQDEEIYYWNGTTTTKITDNAVADFYPSLHDGKIAWARNDGLTNAIYYWDGTTTYRIADIGNTGGKPSLYNGTIAWASDIDGDYEIYYWDGTFPVTPQKITDNTAIDGQFGVSLYDEKIAWARGHVNNHDTEIYYWDGSAIQQISSNPNNDYNPSLYNGQIAWLAYETEFSDSASIHYWDGVFPVVVQKVSDNQVFNYKPSLYDGKIAWSEGSDIVLWDGSAVQKVTDTPVPVRENYPSLYNGTVAWTLDSNVYYSSIDDPIAVAGDDQSILETSSIQLDGSGSTANYGVVMLWEWNFAHRSDPTYNRTASGEQTSLSSLAVGTYDVTLTVTDSVNLQDTDTFLLIVREAVYPSSVAGNDQTINEGDLLILDGSNSTDSDGAIVVWQWLLENQDSPSNSISLSGEVATTSNIASGSYVATLTVTDNDGLQDIDAMLLEVLANPTADAGNDKRLAQGTDVSLSGSNSSDADGSITSWEWNLVHQVDEGNNTTALGETVIVTNLAIGSYIATLTVTDNDGLQDTDTMFLEVLAYPTADTGADQSILDINPLVLDGGSSSDSDGNIESWIWNIDHQNNPSYSRTAVGEHSILYHLAIGSYAITLTITDNDGLQDTNTMLLSVREAIYPTADAGRDQRVKEGTDVVLDGSSSSDSDGIISSWEWSLIHQLDAGNNKDATGEKVIITDLAIGTYTVMVSITDDDGLQDMDTMLLEIDKYFPWILFHPIVKNSPTSDSN